MKGYFAFNYPLFNRVAGELRAQGHEVNNPAEFSDEEPFPLRKAFAACCKYICEEAEAIVLLPGWRKSEGATVIPGDPPSNDSHHAHLCYRRAGDSDRTGPYAENVYGPIYFYCALIPPGAI